MLFFIFCIKKGGLPEHVLKGIWAASKSGKPPFDKMNQQEFTKACKLVSDFMRRPNKDRSVTVATAAALAPPAVPAVTPPAAEKTTIAPGAAPEPKTKAGPVAVSTSSTPSTPSPTRTTNTSPVVARTAAADGAAAAAAADDGGGGGSATAMANATTATALTPSGATIPMKNPATAPLPTTTAAAATPPDTAIPTTMPPQSTINPKDPNGPPSNMAKEDEKYFKAWLHAKPEGGYMPSTNCVKVLSQGGLPGHVLKGIWAAAKSRDPPHDKMNVKEFMM